MAVGFESVGVGDYAGANGQTSVIAEFDHTSSGGVAIAAMSFSAANFQFIWYVDSNEITDLTRTCKYGDVAMQPVADPVAWDATEDAWLEAFALAGSPTGNQSIESKVFGGSSSYRRLRTSVVTYTGVESMGDPIPFTGSGTAMTMTGTAQANDRFVAIYSTAGSISDFNGDVRYLNNSGISLLIGDVAGTGSSQNVTATRQKAGKWSGLLIPLTAADTVASSAPLAFAPRFDPVKLRREQRRGGLQRNVFTVEAPEV